jgi:hypothetical protein
MFDNVISFLLPLSIIEYRCGKTIKAIQKEAAG